MIAAHIGTSWDALKPHQPPSQNGGGSLSAPGGWGRESVTHK